MQKLNKYKEIQFLKMSKAKRFGILFVGLGLVVMVMSLSWTPIMEMPTLADSLIMSALIALGVAVGILVATVVLHEGMHGLFFWLYARRVKFGFMPWGKMGMVAYATSPESVLPRGKMMMVVIAPQFLTVILLAMCCGGFLPTLVGYILLGIAAFNLGGGSSDLHVAYCLAREKGKVFAEDTRTGMILYRE